MAGKPRDPKRGDDEPNVEDTQPLIPGRPTRREVIRFAQEILEKHPRRPDGGSPSA